MIVLFSLAGAIIRSVCHVFERFLSHLRIVCSPKFFRKLSYTSTLSDLACHVPLTQIDIPPAVYQWVIIYEVQILLLTHSQRKSQV